MLTIAIAKGRILKKSADILLKMGYELNDDLNYTRKLIIESLDGKLRVFLVKPGDVPTYVEHGAADLGITGKDVLLEEGRPLYEILDLGFAACKLAAAGYAGSSIENISPAKIRVATKYPNIAREYFQNQGESIEIIKLCGSVELGPLAGLSDVIVDIVESGKTLAENGLSVLFDMYPVSARLVANRVSFKTKYKEIKPFADGIKEVLSKEAQTND